MRDNKHNVYIKDDVDLNIKNIIDIKTKNDSDIKIDVPNKIKLKLEDKKVVDYLLLLLPSVITIVALTFSYIQFEELKSLNDTTKELYVSQIEYLEKEINYWNETVENQRMLIDEQIRANTLSAMYSISAQIIDNPNKSDIILKGILANSDMHTSLKSDEEKHIIDKTNPNYELYKQIEAMQEAGENYVFDNIKIYVTELYHEEQSIRRKFELTLSLINVI